MGGLTVQMGTAQQATRANHFRFREPRGRHHEVRDVLPLAAADHAPTDADGGDVVEDGRHQVLAKALQRGICRRVARALEDIEIRDCLLQPVPEPCMGLPHRRAIRAERRAHPSSGDAA